MAEPSKTPFFQLLSPPPRSLSPLAAVTAHHVILTDSCYYETQPQDGRPGQSLELRQQYPFSQIHSIEPDVYVPHIFYVNFFVAKKVSSKMQLTMNKVKRTFMNSSVSDDGFIVPRAYVCRDALECFQFYMVFSRLLRDWWQQLFEGQFELRCLPKCLSFV